MLYYIQIINQRYLNIAFFIYDVNIIVIIAGGFKMKKISIAELKRQVNGKRVKFITNGVCNQIPFDKISEMLEEQQDKPYSMVTFNTVDMLRTLEDGEISHCCIKGCKVFMNDNGFAIVSPWGTRINVMVYQF